MSHPRSGSTSLLKALSLKCKMCCEPFNRESGEAYEGQSRASKVLLEGLRRHTPVFLPNKSDPSLVEDLYKKWMNTCSSKYDGIKTHYEQLPTRLNQELIDNYTTIILYRKNSLKSALSYIIAKRTGTWQGWGDGSMKDHRSIKSIGRIEPSELNPLMDVLLKSKKEALCTNGLKISYEELFCDDFDKRIETLNQIMDYISLPHVTTQDAQSPEYPLNPNLKVTLDYGIIDNLGELERQYKYWPIWNPTSYSTWKAPIGLL
jgi:hypothetical protein